MPIRTLKEVLHDHVHNSNFKMKILAERLDISYSYLANAVNPDLQEFNFQLRHIISLTNLTKNFQTLDYIESAVGRVAFELPDVSGADPGKLNEELCKTIKEFGDMTQEVGAALKDGRLTRGESKRIEKETMDMVRQALVFLKAVQGLAK